MNPIRPDFSEAVLELFFIKRHVLLSFTIQFETHYIPWLPSHKNITFLSMQTQILFSLKLKKSSGEIGQPLIGRNRRGTETERRERICKEESVREMTVQIYYYYYYYYYYYHLFACVRHNFT